MCKSRHADRNSPATVALGELSSDSLLPLQGKVLGRPVLIAARSLLILFGCFAVGCCGIRLQAVSLLAVQAEADTVDFAKNFWLDVCATETAQVSQESEGGFGASFSMLWEPCFQNASHA